MDVDDKQVDGNHYKNTEIQHWNYVAANNLDYFAGQITKYVTRWKKKNGVKDLEKARHFLDKYIELANTGKLADYCPEELKKAANPSPITVPVGTLLQSVEGKPGVYEPYQFDGTKREVKVDD
jgi:hypothetical protein